jgi:hypothetical protein
VNYYFVQTSVQTAKFTADVTYLPNGCPIDENGIGILPQSASNEVVFRLQFELVL